MNPLPRLALLLALAGLLTIAAPALAQERLAVTFDTSATAAPQFNNQNIVAVWIEDSGGNYVQTIGRWSNSVAHRRYLYDWLSATNRPENNPVPDGYMGATFANYQTGLMLTWTFATPAGAAIPNGDYSVEMELADRNSSSVAQNNRASFPFQKNGTSAQSTTSAGGFNNVTVNYIVPDPSDCGNGMLDSGETCDDSGGVACPGRCDDSGDFCVVSQLQGSAVMCTAECVTSPVTACTDDDGCCPDGCGGMDNDCSTGSNTSGGCNASGSRPGAGLLLLLLVGLLACRRRRA